MSTFFEVVITHSDAEYSSKKLKDAYRTRLVERRFICCFFSLFSALVTALQAIVSPNAHLEFGEWSWDQDTTTIANGFLHCIISSTFFVAAKILAHLLASLQGLNVKLQGRSTDILEAYSLVSEVQTNLRLCRENTDEEFHNLFHDITDEANKVGIEIMVPR